MNPLLALRIGIPLAVVALIAFLWLGLDRANARADALAADLQVQTARAEAAEKRERVMKQAEAERVMDDTRLDTMQEDLTNAIKTAPTGAPGPAATALGCERLRRAGLTSSASYRRLCH